MWDLTKELWAFFRQRGRGWFLPVVLVLLVIGLLAVGAQGSAVAPFIYTLF